MKKFFTLFVVALFATSMLAALTAHQPGVYEKAVNKGGYGATIVTVAERDYEVYGFSYNSSGSKPQILWAGTSTSDASASQVLCSTLSTEVQEIAGWISMSTAGKSSTYSMPSSTEFAASSVGSTGLYQMKMQGHSFTIKVKGYDQFSFLGNDNNADKSKNKYMTVSINGADVTKDVSTSTTIRRYDLDASIESTITITGLGGSNEHIDAFSLRIPSCEPVTNESTFETDADNLVITNLVPEPSASLTFTKGDNQSNPTYVVTKDDQETTDATVEGTTFTATAAGTYIVTATQEADGTYCEVIKQVTITVTAEIPVTACTIAGPASGIIDRELTYTATAANATTFAWYVDGVLQDGETDAEFVYTGVKGNHSIYATATNAHTATPVASNTINLTVTKVCGELISYTAATASQAIDKDFTTTDGIIGGSGHQKSQSNAKLNSGGYYSLQLAEGSFIAGDVVSIYVTPEDSKVPPTLMISSNKNNTDVLGQVTDLTIETSNPAQITLTKGSSVIYLSRDGTVSSQNPIVSRISVSRSCEESNDASVKSLTVNGEAVAKDAELNKFEYTVSTNYAEEHVTVAFTINPLATSDKAGNTFTIPTPSAGDTNGASFKVTAEDGTQVTYTVFITKSATLNNDATLKALAVAGYTLNPVFAAETTTYSITKAYGAKNPAKSKISATANDANAKSIVVDSLANSYTITVTAEDNTTTKVYTINVLEADAPRAINEIFMSNKYLAYIPDGDETNIYAYYLAGEEAATVDSVNRSKGANWTVNEGILRVTGEDSKYSDYTLNIAAVTPVDYTATEIVFDSLNMNSVSAWLKAPYGFDASKGGWKFSKTDGDYTREKAGKTHLELFLPACDTLVLKTGSKGNERDAKYYVNGKLIGDTAKLTKAGVKLVVKQSAPFMLTIASAQTGGDGGLGSIRMAKTIYTVTYNAGENGTCATETAKVAKGEAATLPAVTPNAGYRFDGWFTAATEGTKVGKAGEKITITKDTTLYAQYSEFGFYIAGIGGWDPDQIPVNGISHTFENLAAGSYEFKITKDGTWDTEKGFSDLTASEMIAGLYGNNNNNVCFTLAEAGDVTITYDGEVFKAEGNFVPQVIKVKGGWDEWAEHTAELSDDKKSASVTLNLAVAENVEFGILYNEVFRANGKTFVRDDNSATDITGNTANMKLTSDKAGSYTFTWTFGTNGLEITFPSSETALDNVAEEGKAVKRIVNGMLIIEKNGRIYNAMGIEIR